jgi:hypothetical protein
VGEIVKMGEGEEERIGKEEEEKDEGCGERRGREGVPGRNNG